MKKVLLLLADGFETFEASVFIDVIGWNLVDGDHTTQLFTCGLRKQVKTSFNQTFVVDYLVDELDLNAFDALAIPGGFEEYDFYKDAYDERFLNIIRQFKSQGKPIASICVAALSLGKSGILTNKRATIYRSPVRQNQLKDFGVNLIQERIVVDDNVITSWDPSTAIDVALLLLQMLTSPANADHIRHIMGFGK